MISDVGFRITCQILLLNKATAWRELCRLSEASGYKQRKFPQQSQIRWKSPVAECMSFKETSSTAGDLNVARIWGIVLHKISDTTPQRHQSTSNVGWHIIMTPLERGLGVTLNAARIFN